MIDAPQPPQDYAYDETWQGPPKWPKAVGTISIVWGALSLTCAGCGVASFFTSQWTARMVPPEWGPMPPVMQPGIAQLALQGVGLLWAVFLIIAGIMVINRSPAGRGLHLLYAAGAIVMTVLATVLAIQHQAAVAAWARQNPDNMWAKSSNPMLASIALALGVTLGLAWPVFCLVWFGLVKRRPEDLHGGEPPVA